MIKMKTKEEILFSLQNLGLRKNEAKVYLALTELDQSTTAMLTKLSGIPRSKIYDVISQLESLNLIISEKSEGGVNIFKVLDLEGGILKMKETLITKIEKSATNAIQGLNEYHQTQASGKGALQEAWTLKGINKIQNTITSIIQKTKVKILCALDYKLLQTFSQEIKLIIDRNLTLQLLVSSRNGDKFDPESLKELRPFARVYNKKKILKILDNLTFSDENNTNNLMKILELVFTERPNIIIFDPETEKQNSMLILNSSDPAINLIAIHLDNKEFIKFQRMSLERMWNFLEKK